MKVLRVRAHNVMRLEDVDLNMKGENLFLVGGANGNGKTSVIKAITMALLGRSGMDQWPSKPLRDGEDEGFIEIDLSGSEAIQQPMGITVRANFTRKPDGGIKEELEVLDAAGDPAPSPIKLLHSLIKTRAIDPLAFERMKPKEQRDQLLSMVGLDLDDFEARYKEAFSKRTEVNRDGKELAAAVATMPDHEPVEPVDTDDLSKQLQKVQEHNDMVRQCVEKHKRDVAAADAMVDAEKDAEQAVAACKEALVKAEKHLAEAKDKRFEAAKIARQSEACPEIKSADEIMQKIGSASEVNRIAAEIKAKEVATEKLEAKRAESAALTKKLKAIEKEKDAAIKKAEFPVNGLAVDANGVTIDGFAFSDACRSQRIVTSALIGVALNPELRLLLSQDGSDLDVETLEALGTLLKEHDFQMVVELVSRSREDEDRCQVIIEDGKIK